MQGGAVQDEDGSIKLKTVCLSEGGGERRDGKWCAAHGGLEAACSHTHGLG